MAPPLMPTPSAIAAISRQSEITTPSYCISPRSKSVSTPFDRVAGTLVSASKAGNTTCAVMMASTPAAIAARNGASSTACNRALSCGTSAIA